MAKYKASPFYSVHTPNGKLTFDHLGEFETTNADEIATLSGLCPHYLVCMEEEKAVQPKAQQNETKPEAKPKAPTRKASAK